MARPTNQQKRQREAKAILDSDTFRDLLRERREQIVADWEIADTVESREGFHAQLKALNELRDYINGEAKERSKQPR